MTAKPRKARTVGFGCPDTRDPHHLEVVIPAGRSGKVRLTERFGIRGIDGSPEEIDRVELEREKWTLIADPTKKEFNERLKSKGLQTGRWEPGTNKVERLLGKELVVLAWAVEHAALELVPAAVSNWAGLKPDDRWWLFTVAAAATGELGDGNIGWRKAIRYALTENPVDSVDTAKKPRRRRAQTAHGSLFDSTN